MSPDENTTMMTRSRDAGGGLMEGVWTILFSVTMLISICGNTLVLWIVLGRFKLFLFFWTAPQNESTMFIRVKARIINMILWLINISVENSMLLSSSLNLWLITVGNQLNCGDSISKRGFVPRFSTLML